MLIVVFAAASLETAVTVSKLKERLAKEMQEFELSGVLGENLQRADGMLSSIKPTSITSEQAFSTAGQFATKIRSQLGDNTLDALCFLRAYFQILKSSS